MSRQYSFQERREQRMLHQTQPCKPRTDQCSTVYLGIFVVVLLTGVATTMKLHPGLFFSPKQAMRPRQIVTIFPAEVTSKLPVFTGKYSIATEDNKEASKLLQLLTQKRKALGSTTFLQSWEQSIFERQLYTKERMDAACGVVDYWQTYHNHVHLQKDLMYWCLLQGQPDGFIDWEIQLLPNWTRSITGVVAKYIRNDNSLLEDRVDSSLVLLPIEDSGTQQFRHSLSKSSLPMTILDWIVEKGSKTPISEYRERLEIFLYHQIEQNHSQWTFWTVACSSRSEPSLDDQRFTLMATTCPNTTSNDMCCSYYVEAT